jgi:AraC-like DNA-binding protein
MQKNIQTLNLSIHVNEEDFQNHIIKLKLKERLLHSFEDKKLFLKKDLNIWDLCRETNSNRTYISKVINEEFGMNFSCFVNKYRITHALNLLKNLNYQEKSIEKIAYMSGFNSLTSFNRAFKKITNYSPGSYRSKMAEQIS